VQRVNRRLERLENALSDLRGAEDVPSYRDKFGRLASEQRAGIEGELEDGRKRLKQLLGKGKVGR
jgi:hypothetical protein